MWARRTPQIAKDRRKQGGGAEGGRREKSLYEKYLEDTSLFNPTQKSKQFFKH